MKTITVVGASLAGLYAATELRAQGFEGTLVIAGEEPHRPYDRPPLSKGFLTGELTRGQLALDGGEGSDDDTELAAHWLTGRRATGVDTRERTVIFDDGRRLVTDGLIIATGAKARRLPGPHLTGVHTLRTLDDAEALRAELALGTRRVVIIGGGFIGAEVASSCAAGGHQVTVVEAAPTPLIAQLGAEMAVECAKLHGDHGVTLLCGTGVAALHGGDAPHGGAGDGAEQQVTGVELSDGRVLPADVVVTGIGASPATGWLEGSGIALHDGVLCDSGCLTAVPGVAAAGDVARVGGVRAEHWSSATAQARVAARNLLAGACVEEHRGVPYFWSDQYGVRLQFAGQRGPADTVHVAEGSPQDRSFLAVYTHEGRTTAVLALNRPRSFTRARRQLTTGARPSLL